MTSKRKRFTRRKGASRKYYPAQKQNLACNVESPGEIANSQATSGFLPSGSAPVKSSMPNSSLMVIFPSQSDIATSTSPTRHTASYYSSNCAPVESILLASPSVNTHLSHKRVNSRPPDRNQKPSSPAAVPSSSPAADHVPVTLSESLDSLIKNLQNHLRNIRNADRRKFTYYKPSNNRQGPSERPKVLDTVSILEEAALRDTNLTTTNDSSNKNSDLQNSDQSDKLLQSSSKCPVKRKSDTEVDVNSKLPKRSSRDCVRLLESATLELAQPESQVVAIEVIENQKPTDAVSKKPSPKPTTSWKMGNAGNTSGCGMRIIPTACQRKFPGPAGLLPERTNRVSYTLNESGGPDMSSQSEVPLLSQPTQTLDVGPWHALRCDLQDATDLLDKYTVSWVKQKVATRRLAGQKIPFLAAVLHNVDTSSPDPIIVLRDKTGYINGSIHRSVWESHGGQLVQGSALLLRLVGVACTGSATQQRLYVNVTSNNIVTIYSPSFDGDVNVTEVHPLDIKEMRQRISEWEAKCKADAAAATSTGQNSSLFSSVLDRTPLRQLAPSSPAAPRPPNPGRSGPPQRPPNTNLQNSNNSAPIQNSKEPNSVSPGSSSGVAPRSSFLSRVELPKTSNQIAQNNIVTSTQTFNAELMNVDVSSFLDGLDTDLLFDDF